MWICKTLFVQNLNFMKQLAFKVIITDRNPDQDGLVDVHQCAYLPSIYDDNQKALVSKALATDLSKC